MKRVIKATTDTQVLNWHGTAKYFVRFDKESSTVDNFVIQISKVSPYDDADYVWAEVNQAQGLFIQDGKVIDKMMMWTYEDEWFESEDEFFDNVIDTVIYELEEYNSEIDPKIIHN